MKIISRCLSLFLLIGMIFLVNCFIFEQFVSAKEQIPRKAYVFHFKASLIGVEGEYLRTVDINENGGFYITDEVGKYRWMTAADFRDIRKLHMGVKLWLGWDLAGISKGTVKTSFSLKIGDGPKQIPERNKSLVAYAWITETGSVSDVESESYLEGKHPAHLIIEGYINALRNNDYRKFRTCFVLKSGTGLANISRSLFTKYRNEFWPKYRRLIARDIKVKIMNKTDDSFDYVVVTKGGEVVDVTHLKSGKFKNIRENTWKIVW